MRKWRILFVGLLLVPLAAAPLWGQGARASLNGRVMDNTGGVIPGVNVTAANTATGVEFPTVTNDTGLYRIDFLTPGPYDVTASLPGFKTTTQTIDLRTGDDPTVDFTLVVGEVTEQITVQAQAPLLQSTNATLSNLIEAEQIETLPMAQGNPSHLLVMAPGASSPPGGGWKWDEPGWSITTGFYFHGSQGNAVGFTLNGINNVGTVFGGAQQAQTAPPAEAVKEIKISHDYTAARGHHNGTTMDVTLKSGTNDWHGSVYGFFRQSAWAANAFFQNRAGSPKADTKYRRTGGGINGPIFKDQTHVAFNWERTFQQTLEFYGARTVPTGAMKGGDFSALLALEPEYQIYDPSTIQATGDRFFSRMPFPNNVIPASRIHPISQQLMSYYPEPNLAGGSDSTGNFEPSTASPTQWEQWFLRVDHTFGPSNRIFGSLTKLDNWAGEWRDYYGNGATGFHESVIRETFGVDDVWTVNPNVILNFRGGYNRGTDPRVHKSHKLHPRGEPFDIFSLPLADSLKAQLDPDQSALPHVQIESFSGIHDETRNNFDFSTYVFGEAATDIHEGNHNIKLGVEARSNYLNRNDQRWSNPVYRFRSTYTNGPLNTSPSAQGQGFASFLLGQPSTGFINRNDNYAAHHNYYAWFIQDNWKATPELTFNFGIRWEYFAPLTERFDRSVAGFAFDTASPVAAAAQAAYAMNPIPDIAAGAFAVNGGITYAGVGDTPRALYDVPSNIFAPRFGFAYRLGEDTVIRGGYGIFHQPIGILGNSVSPILTGYSQTTDLVPTFDNGQTFVADFANPFPDGILSPIGNARGLATNLGQSVSFFNENNLKVPYNQRWSLTVQHMLGSTLLELGYIGTRGVRIIGGRNLNVLPERYLSSANVRNNDNHAYLNTAVPNPFAGLLPGTGLNTNTVSRRQLLLPYPQFTGVSLNQTNQGYSWYHAFESRLERRLAGGFSYSLGYTWSRFHEAVQFLNSSDAVPFEVVARADRPHNFKLSGIYQLPWGKNSLLGGWQVSAVWQLQSGFPLNFGNVFTTDSFSPDRLSGGGKTVEKWFNTNAGFVRNPSEAPEGTHKRTFPLRFAQLRSDFIDFWDVSVIKDTYINDDHRIRFQAQFLNALNHASFGAANTSPTSGSFGRVGSDVTWPRRIMMSVKWMF